MSKKRPRSNSTEQRMAANLDRLAAFEAFEESIAPALRAKVRAGAKPEEIYALVKAHLAARQVTIALTDADPAKALAAIKDIMDRTDGKPTERKEIEHRYSKLKDQELDSLLLSELEGVELDEGDSDADDVH